MSKKTTTTQKRQKTVKVPKQSKAEQRAEAIRVVRATAEASHLEFFHDLQQKAYATVPVGDHRETWRIRSREFKFWVMNLLYTQLHAAPKTLVTAVLEEFETHAICAGKEFDVHLRIAEHEGATYIDLVNDHWQVLEVTATGWSILDNSPVKFRRARGTTSLPYPQKGGNFRDIARFLNIGSQSEVLLLAWLTYALRPNNPYPIIALSGVQGAGKSTITRVLRSLIDPSLAALTTIPKSERDVAIAATNSHLIAMDNLSEISAELSDILCRVATGGSFRTRELYTNDDEMIFTYRRPLIINGIEELPIRPDLLDRSILIHVEPISEERRQDEQNFWQDFENVRPQLLGRMLDVICEGIRQLPAVKLDASPRMADFARWGIAVEQAMGFAAGSFMAAYQSNREDASAAALESSPIAMALHCFLGHQTEEYYKGQPARKTYRRSFEGAALNLLSELRLVCEHGGYVFGQSQGLKELLRHPKFPKTANMMSAEIARIEPTLKKLHITVERGRTYKGRYLKLERTDLPPDAAPRASVVAEENATSAAVVEVTAHLHSVLNPSLPFENVIHQIIGNSPNNVGIQIRPLAPNDPQTRTKQIEFIYGLATILERNGWRAIEAVEKMVAKQGTFFKTKRTVPPADDDAHVDAVPSADMPQVAVEVGS